MTIALVETHLPQHSLDALAATANREHSMVGEALSSALAHAIAAGDALNAAHALLPHGQWLPWLASNFQASEATAHLYRRIAVHKDAVSDAGMTTIQAARRWIVESGLGGGRHVRAHAKERHEEWRVLTRQGKSREEIAELYGVTPQAVYLALAPAAKRRRKAAQWQRRRQAALKALHRDEDTKIAKRFGGDLGEAWTAVVKLAKLLDAARVAEQGETRAALADALASVYTAEDRISRALRTK